MPSHGDALRLANSRSPLVALVLGFGSLELSATHILTNEEGRGQQDGRMGTERSNGFCGNTIYSKDTWQDLGYSKEQILLSILISPFLILMYDGPLFLSRIIWDHRIQGLDKEINQRTISYKLPQWPLDLIQKILTKEGIKITFGGLLICFSTPISMHHHFLSYI